MEKLLGAGHGRKPEFEVGVKLIIAGAYYL
jgi:hypothetical protein